MDKELLHRAWENLSVALLFDPRDFWIGVYWDRQEWVWGWDTTVYITLIPMFPVRVSWERNRA